MNVNAIVLGLPNIFIVSCGIAKCVREIIRGRVMWHYLTTYQLIQDQMNSLCNRCQIILALRMLMLFALTQYQYKRQFTNSQVQRHSSQDDKSPLFVENALSSPKNFFIVLMDLELLILFLFVCLQLYNTGFILVKIEQQFSRKGKTNLFKTSKILFIRCDATINMGCTLFA